MVTRIVESWAFSLLGWALAIGEAFPFRYLYRARDRTHEDEMKRTAIVKNELMQQKLGFELPSSEPPPK